MTQLLPGRHLTILVVDDEPSIRKIVALLLRGEDCEILQASNVKEAEAILKERAPDLMVLDIGLPGESGLDFLARIHSELGETLVVMSTGVDDAMIAVRAMRLGAKDYIVKPYSHGTFLASIKNVLEKRDLERENEAYKRGLEDTVIERTQEVEEAQDATVFAMAKIAQSRDDETGLHLERMRDYSVSLARHMLKEGHPEVDNAFITDLFRSAPLHDIGKVGIPDAILLKRDRLTPEEFELMKTHSVIGAQCLDGAANLAKSKVGSFLRMGKQVARHHHEAWDGQGYPDKLTGTQIPLAARIVSLADFYDALAFPRVYRPTAFPHEEIRQMILELGGKKFDPEIVSVFLAVESDFLRTRTQRADESTHDDIPAG
jgi:putative two-component system response regulator